ncbi:alcohol dehydrogenase [Rhodococcus sp. ACS1]|uniref:NADPH2:quinone reductase n=1 Tax=Rhodococcus jostii TaxID=132919 RepID=A0A1H4J9C4_RHOJO|nr:MULTISPECIES: NADPH:quinone oxidoreductase family protein [Rhodococcus]PBC39562.1 alcohol dehydrogenase [Rhodococcus sp. ACS1]SEB42675.1 NADPH2:quinone reductase [Rhodococcus jostii]
MTRAWQVHEYGEPGSVLTLGNVPDLNPGDGQVRVRVAATSCNFADVLLCRGQYQHKPVPPFTPGLEVCGIIDGIGEGVDPTLLGTRIVGQPILPHGGFAETALMNAADTYSVPGLIDDSTAATLHLTYLTAFLGLHRRAAMRAGDTVVVTAAAGGVGSAAVQIARAAGARVIGIVSGADKADAAARMGADTVIDRTTADVIECVRAAAPDGADIVFDTAGGQAYELATKYIAFEGRIIVVGFASGSIPQPHLNHAFVKNYTISGLHWSLYQRYRPELVRHAQTAIFEMASKGKIEPLITAQVGLDDLPDALEDLARGRTQGKMVVTPQH